MNWTKRIPYIIFILGLVSCTNDTDITRDILAKSMINADELQQIIASDKVKIIDMRSEEEYEKNHIPGAIHITRNEIQSDTLPYHGVIDSKRNIEATLGRKGIGSSDHIVVYDNKAMCEGARFWWVMQYYGHHNVSLLSGGIKKWSQIGELTSQEASMAKADFRFDHQPQKTLFIELDELVDRVNSADAVIIDARSIQEYDGEYIKKGAFKAGHIPGSINLDWGDLVDMESQHFLPVEELFSKLNNLDIRQESDIIVYCHSGVRSAHTTFVLTQLLGYKHVRNYDGSWVEWSYHDLPAALN